MGLSITLVNADYFRDAVLTVMLGRSGMVMVIWCPEFLALETVFPDRLPEGENPVTLLKMPPESFSSYDCQDDHFNAAVKSVDFARMLIGAKDSDTIEFSQSFEDNGVNGHGYLNANFKRYIATKYAILPEGALMTFQDAMKIHGILPESVVKSLDPSALPLLPVATFRANDFAQCMATLKNSGFKVLVNAVEKEVRFFKEGSSSDPLVVNQLNGLISTGEDCKVQPIEFYIHIQNVEFQPAADLSDEVSLLQRSEKAVLIRFKLSLLKGDLIHYLH